MREYFVKAVATVAFVIATVFGATGHAQAQSLANPIRVNIPFDFVVGNKTYAAGQYVIRRAQPNSGDGMVSLSTADGKTRVVRLSNSVQTLDPKQKNTLVFHRYGDQRFLAQVWPAGANIGRQLPKSRAERDLEQKAREIVRIDLKAAPTVETITITDGQR